MSVKLWTTNNTANANGIFVDSSGYIHVCGYQNRTSTSKITYAVSTDGGVTFTDGEGGASGSYKEVVSVYYPDAFPAIVVDSSSNVYIIYPDKSPNQVRYIKKSGGSGGTWGSATAITGATHFLANLRAEIDSDDNIIIFGGGYENPNYYYCCYTSVDGGANWVAEITSTVNGIRYDCDLCIGFNSNLYASWYYGTDYHIKSVKITKTENSPDSWVVESVDNDDATLSGYYANAIMCEKDSETLWLFRSYKDGSNYQLQYKKKSGGSWGSWTTIATNTTKQYLNYQVLRSYLNKIYIVYEKYYEATPNLYYMVWDGFVWSSEATFLSNAYACNIQQPNFSKPEAQIYFIYRTSNDLRFEKFSVPAEPEQEIDTDTLTLSDTIELNVSREKVDESDILLLSDEIALKVSREQVIESDILSLSDTIGFGAENEEDDDTLSLSDEIELKVSLEKVNESDILILSDIIDITRTISTTEEDTLILLDEIEARIPIEFIHNKTSFLDQIISNINNKFSMLKNLFIKTLNKITIRSLGLYKCKNDFRMRESWQVPANGGIQSLGKEYVKVYINYIEQTDVDVDSISITKGLNNAHTANLILGRPYDATAPDIESVIEIKYHIWTLFKGYITQITPTDNPEEIQLYCADEMWMQNKTRVYFLVGHLPYGAIPGEWYYITPSYALSALGIGANFGNFIPQTINCWGKAQSDATTDIITNCGNFGWFYDENENPLIWRAGEGDIITLEAQEFNKNLGLYQVLTHSFKSDVTNIINDLRIQMGIFVDALGNRQYQGYTYENVYFQPIPAWDVKLEVLANSITNLSYGFNWQLNPSLYNDVFKKYTLDAYGTLLSADEEWADRYTPRVEIGGGGFGWICNKPIGIQKDGFSIDYKNATITFSEPIYFKKLNENGEIIAIQHPQVWVTLYKKVHQPPTTYPNPLWFYTGKMGDYSLTNYGDLALSGLSIQRGGFYTDENGDSKYIPGWDDTDFARDYANWQLSKTCDEKILGNINLTLDAICFYNIDLSKRIQIPGIQDTPLNIINMTYRLSDFQVTLQLENRRSYYRTVSIQSRGEDYF